jgi:hypothetical protein
VLSSPVWVDHSANLVFNHNIPLPTQPNPKNRIIVILQSIGIGFSESLSGYYVSLSTRVSLQILPFSRPSIDLQVTAILSLAMDLSPIEQQQAINGLKQRTELNSSEDSPSPIRQNQDHHPSFDIQSESAQSSPTIVLTSHQTDRPDDQHPVIIHEQIDPRFGQETLPIKFHSPSFKPGSTQDNLASSFDDISLENNPDEPPKSVHQDLESKEEEEAHHLQQPPSPQELPTQNPTPSTPISPENNSNNNHKGRSGSSSPALTVQSSRPTPSRDSTLQETSTIASFSTTQTVASTHSAVSPVLVISSLDSIASSKEAKKSKELGEATKAALALLKGEQLTSDLGIPSGPNQEAQIILQPLKLACQTASSVLMVTALDCIGKLISYSFFKVSDPGPSLENNGDNPTKASFQVLADVEMGDEVTGIICDCFADAACPDAVQLQIIKALLALVLAPTHPGVRRLQVHQSSLLRAVRTVYNIFLLSKSPTNQAIAQGTLTQIVSHVFGRVEKGEEPALRSLSLRRNESSHRPPSSPKPQDNDSTEPPADVSGSPVTPRPQSSVNTSPSSVIVHDENGPSPSAPDTPQDSPTKSTDQKTNAGVSKEEAQVTL